ncbi:MAG TPA: TatD family hydrolase [Gammaproteobacteria bacterium]|nr:TatD family hydrolase [Gammaproteobacteria bacterium]
MLDLDLAGNGPALDLVDIGANLTHDSYDRDRADVIARAQAAGVRRMIVTGSSVTVSLQAAALAASHPSLYSTSGIHPHHAQEFDEDSIAALHALAAQPRVVAIGECGLDYFRDFSPRDAQARAFAAQLELAAETGLPAFLHQRDAHEPFVRIVSEHRGRLSGGAVAHCFTGGPEELAAYLDLDLYIGITGWICDERRGGALREALPRIPLDRLLLETDAPYLLPRDLEPKPRDRRNEPKFLPHVLSVVARIVGRAEEEIARATTRNAETLFRLSAGAAV